jgi:choline dehydrogenase-like flavoprotein
MGEGGVQQTDAALPETRADVCIIGAGPAGIAIARALAQGRLTTCIVESGGDQPSATQDELAHGSALGEEIHPLEENTRRAFGGASQAWDIRTGLREHHVRHMPLDEADFEPHAWIAHSGWPFGCATLVPWYERAQLVCGIGPFDYAAASWEAPEARRLSLDPAVVETAICQFGPAALFHQTYREELRRAERVGKLQLLLGTTALRLEADPDGRAVDRLICSRQDGTRHAVAARVFVLAAGGHQNARLLLMSGDPPGLGNRHDVVGRYLHDHPLVFGGLLTPSDPASFALGALYDIRSVRDVPVMGYLGLAAALRRDARLASLATFLFPRPEPRSTHALEAIRDGIRAMQGSGAMPIGALSVAKLLARRPGVALRGVVEAARGRPVLSGFKVGGWSRQAPPGTGWRSFHVWHQVEQSPDPENRVTLGQERDRFGCRLPAVHWRWSAEDDARVARAQTLIAEEVEASGLGRLDLVRRDGRTDLAYPAGAHHVMGTTRMHADPRQGVVDADCRVHGVGNLFVAGSSVFPTGGSANPTLTVIALALRLADHLQAEFATCAAVPRRAAQPEPQAGRLGAASASLGVGGGA